MLSRIISGAPFVFQMELPLHGQVNSTFFFLIWNKLLAPSANSELELFKNPQYCNPDRDCSDYFNGTKAIVESRASVENDFAAPVSCHPLLRTRSP